MRTLIFALAVSLTMSGSAFSQDDSMELLVQRDDGGFEVQTLTDADVGLTSDADAEPAVALPDELLLADGSGVLSPDGSTTPLSSTDADQLAEVLGGKSDPDRPSSSAQDVLSGGRGRGEGPVSFDGLAYGGRGGGPGQAAPAPRVFRVIGTAEGLIGHRTATGLIIKAYTEAVALPSRSALNRKTRVVYLANNRETTCKVLDVGPWNTNDPYWERADGRPQAASGRDRSGRRTNRAGIDIFNGSWYKLLGLRTYDRYLIENTMGTVEWNFES